MTDKIIIIIIDGVDVKECEHYKLAFEQSTENNKIAASTILDLQEQLQAEKEKVRELEEENEKLKIQLMQKDEVNTFFNTPIEGWSDNPCGICKYKQALEEIKEIATKGLKPICYKFNCSKCRCYIADDANANLTALINSYFDKNGNFADGNDDFVEALEGLLNNERIKCNKAQPICEQILQNVRC